jgi:hypothetical protein
MNDRQHSGKVVLEGEYTAFIMGIDGTWGRQCTLNEVSTTGATLTIEGPTAGLILEEFFLLLSSTGLAYRRCELAWVNGQEIGVNYRTTKARSKSKTKTALAHVRMPNLKNSSSHDQRR